MNIQLFKYLQTIAFLWCFCVAAFAQSIDSELKKDLWKTIKPVGKRNSLPLDSAQKMKRLPSRYISTVPSVHLNKKDLLPQKEEKFSSKDSLKIDPKVYTFSKEELMKVEPNTGMTTSQFGGLIQNSSKNTGGGVPLGILEPGQKKLSKKTKKILINVYHVPAKDLEGK